MPALLVLASMITCTSLVEKTFLEEKLVYEA
jgi:hypothetical protein